jgi:uncharacterized RDD family membrane protein YckC
MSEMSQGPGWWLASDGKWYPPQLHPSMGPPPPPPPPPSAFRGSSGAGSAAPPFSAPGAWSMPNPGSAAAVAPWAGQYDGGAVDPVLGLPLAPWWKRLIAIIIDGIVLGLGVFFVFLAIGIAINASHSQGGTGTGSTSSQSHGAALVLGLLILFLLASIPLGLYYAIMNGRWRGQTVGKLALSIAVRDARTGTLIGFWRAFGRYLITIVFMLLLYLPYLIDSLAPLWDRRRQAWHDKVVHSVVVDLKP